MRLALSPKSSPKLSPKLSPKTMQALAGARSLASDLLDAFVAQIAPIAARLTRAKPLVAVLVGDTLTLHAVRGPGRVEPLGGLDAAGGLRGQSVDLRLPKKNFLRRTLVLPDTGRDYLKPIIAHRLERLTPWRPDRVLYGYRVEPGERPDGTVAIELLATAAERAAPHLAALEAAGLDPCSLGSAEDPLDQPPRIDLLRERAGGPDARLRGRVARAFTGAMAGLVPVCLLAAWLAQSAEDEQRAVSERLATLQRHMQRGRGETTARDRALIEAKKPETSALLLLDRLSAALPDHTALRELDIAPDKVRLVGTSGDAPALVGRLEGEAGLSAVRFAAPVTRDAERRDLFDIVAARPNAAGKGQ